MIYGLRRMIYLLRKHDIISVPSYAEGIYHPPQVDIITPAISPVPQGTDIIEKRQVSVETCRFSWLWATKKVFSAVLRMNSNSRSFSENGNFYKNLIIL